MVFAIKKLCFMGRQLGVRIKTIYLPRFIEFLRSALFRASRLVVQGWRYIMRLTHCLRFTCCIQPQKKWVICALLYLTIMVPVSATDDAHSDQLPTTTHEADHPDPAKPYCEKGQASWYGSYFHGKKTSSGERFDMHEMTAAHRTLPIPSYAKVTNLHNGKSIIVRINDRGPFKKQRIIDLSYAAAHQLGFIEKGHTVVSIEAL